MKAVLVIDIPNEYADRYNINEMYVWSLTVQDKQGYQMFDITTDKPNHLKPLPKCRYCRGNGKRFLQTCLKAITGEE